MEMEFKDTDRRRRVLLLVIGAALAAAAGAALSRWRAGVATTRR